MKRILSIALLAVLLMSGFACKRTGEAGPCSVNVTISVPELSEAALTRPGGIELESAMQVNADGTLAFDRDDVADMPYVALLTFTNPADSMDVLQIPVAIEKGDVTVELGDIVKVSGTPTNELIDDFLLERFRLQSRLLPMVESGEIGTDGIHREYSKFYAAQIVKYSGTPLARFILDAYGNNITVEDRDMVEKIMQP